MTRPLSVLLIEDSATDAKLVVQALQQLGRPFDIERVEDAGSLREALAKQTWDVVLSDWSLPGFHALAALAVVKEHSADTPFILVSGTVGEEKAADAMRAGANDYVLKDNLVRLAPAVDRELREAADRKARRGAEAALRAQEARFRGLIEKSEEGISLSDHDGTTLYMSPAAERVVGYSAAQRVGRDAAEITHADDRARRGSALAQLMTQPGGSAKIETRVVRPDGSHRWIEGTVTNLLDDPAVGAIVTNFRDVTERRQVIDAMRASEARYRMLFDAIPLPIYMFERKSLRFLAVNDAAVIFYGYTRDEMLSMSLTDLKPDDDIPRMRAEIDRAADGTQAVGVRRQRLKNGMVVEVEIAVHAARLDDQDVSVAVCKDVTETRRLEEQLRQAQKMEAVGRLAGGIAHDFNNVLSVILTFSELGAADLSTPEPLREDLGEIHKAAERATDLTRQLLMFSRRQVLEPRILDLGDVMNNMDKMLRRLVGEDVEIDVRCERSQGRVRADQSSVEQVVMNLVVNARDAMPTGGKLTIETADVVLDDEYARTHVGVRAGPHVMLAVTDTGTGMDPATQTRIFEPFFTTKPAGKGTGLGLSTVFGIVHQSEGSIWVYSEVGRGTSFKVFLPRVDAAADAQIVQSTDELPRGTETILLVDDESAVRLAASSILRRQGYEVIEAGEGGEALRLSQSHEGAIHLLLSDVVMPKMSGPELVRQLRVTRPGMKVLCMSGYTDDSIVRHGVLDAALAYIQKPITRRTLSRKVRDVLDAPLGQDATQLDRRRNDGGDS